MRTRVKICGITRAQDARAAVRAGADAIGFVLWPGSPRRVSLAKARAIGRLLPPFVTRVGVFVNATPADVAGAVRQAALDAVQLHGDEDPRAYRSCGAAVIKAVSLSRPADVGRAARYPRDISVLVDARDDVRRGGTGRVSNWTLARRLARIRPILLAGGLQAANVAQAIRAVRPWGIDLSSGVETAPGRKSATKMRAVLARVARTNREAV
jgi:phosphoribosylanthranilate isomerase